MYYRQNSLVKVKKIKNNSKTASGSQSDKRQPAPATSVQSVKSPRHYEHDSSTFSLRERIFSQQCLPRDKKIAVRCLKAPFGGTKLCQPVCVTEK